MTKQLFLRLFQVEDVDASIPEDWIDQVQQVASEHSVRTVLDGSSETSRENGNVAIEVHVADGITVRRFLPWLDTMYRTTIAELASATTGRRMVASEDLRNGVNINSIRGEGGRYEKHVDSNPLTGALFISDHSLESGGVLEFEAHGAILHVEPRAGLLALFDGRSPHTVTPLRHETTRLSVVMNFFEHGQRQARPLDLDHYLYGCSERDPKEASSSG